MNYLSIMVQNNRIENAQLHGELENAIRTLIEQSYHAIEADGWDARVFTELGVPIFEYPLFEAEKALDQGLTAKAFAESVLAVTDTERLELLALNSKMVSLGDETYDLDQFSNQELRRRYDLLNSTFDNAFSKENDTDTQLERCEHKLSKVQAASEDALSVLEDTSLTSEELSYTLGHNLGLLLQDLK